MPKLKLIPSPKSAPGAEEHARAETERKRRLFDWADHLLEQLGLPERVAQAKSVEELRKITFDANAVEVELAIRDALHPANGSKDDCFVGIKEGGLKRILQNRFEELKRERETKLRDGVTGAARSAHDWTDDLKLDKKGGVCPLLTNLILFLRKHRAWQGVLGFDEFNTRVVIRKLPPWGEEAPDAPWTDHHESLTRVWFQREDINANQGDAARAVQAAARANSFHPVRDYFDALVWDRTPRLDTWLVTYFHADNTPYARAIGPRFLISVVARIYQPGCKVDHVLVLEGPQGKLKSEALRTLAINDAWFTDRLSHVASKDAALDTAGVLLIEIAELDALTRASPSAIKSFLTRRFDRFRPPYGKHPIRLPRQCVFAGSINPPTGGYLKDPTGSRRIWPVAFSYGPTFRLFLRKATHFVDMENLDRSAWGAHFFGRVLHDVKSKGALEEVIEQRNNIAHGREAMPLAKIKKFVVEGLQLEAWEQVPQTDGELCLVDWRPWVGTAPTGTGQIGLFERWQKDSLRYLVPETGETFNEQRS